MIRYHCFSRLVSPVIKPGGGGVECGYRRADGDVRCDGCDHQPVELMLQRCFVAGRKEAKGVMDGARAE